MVELHALDYRLLLGFLVNKPLQAAGMWTDNVCA